MTLSRSPLAPKTLPRAKPVAGIQFYTGSSGTKYKGRDDVFLATFPSGTTAAASFTQNQVVGAPVTWTRNLAHKAAPRALIVNAGNANVAVGSAGQATVEEIGLGIASLIGVEPSDVWQASTGVIGEPLDPDPIIGSISQLPESDIEAAAAACLTTDTFPKMAAREFQIDGETVSISGFAKGSGMIHPNMATMLAFVFTDAKINAVELQEMHQRAVAETFNAITVDGDTSTSDMALTFASGRGAKLHNNSVFFSELREVYRDLAQLIVRDGEGATKFITIDVAGASSIEAAKTLAFSVANSPLVKTAIAGEDANWGRVMMALGRSGIEFDDTTVSVSIGGLPIVEAGARIVDYNEEPIAEHLRGQDIELSIKMGAGDGKFTVWTCDLTHGYISINADYRS